MGSAVQLRPLLPYLSLVIHNLFSPSFLSIFYYLNNTHATILTAFAVHGLSQAWQLKALNYRKTGQNRYFHTGAQNY